MVLGIVFSCAGSYVANKILPEKNAIVVAGVGMVIGTALELIICPPAALLDGALAAGGTVAIAQGGKLIGKSAKSVAKTVVKKGIKKGSKKVKKSLLTNEEVKLVGTKKATAKAGTALIKKAITNTSTTGAMVLSQLEDIDNDDIDDVHESKKEDWIRKKHFKKKENRNKTERMNKKGHDNKEENVDYDEKHRNKKAHGNSTEHENNTEHVENDEQHRNQNGYENKKENHDDDEEHVNNDEEHNN